MKARTRRTEGAPDLRVVSLPSYEGICPPGYYPRRIEVDVEPPSSRGEELSVSLRMRVTCARLPTADVLAGEKLPLIEEAEELLGEEEELEESPG